MRVRRYVLHCAKCACAEQHSHSSVARSATIQTRWRETARPLGKRRTAAGSLVERPESRRRVDEVDGSAQAEGRVAPRAASTDDAVRGVPAVSENGTFVSAAGTATGTLFAL